MLIYYYHTTYTVVLEYLNEQKHHGEPTDPEKVAGTTHLGAAPAPWKKPIARTGGGAFFCFVRKAQDSSHQDCIK